MDERLLELDWLKENLPDLLKVWISLNNEINCKIDKPFNFNKAKLTNVSGNVSKNLPPIANNIASKSSPIMTGILKLFETFFEGMVENFFNKK